MTKPQLGQAEFVALIAMMFATIAFSVDTMLPGLNTIGRELSPTNPNLAQFVITSFVFGMGIGTLFVGPISDAFGRKPVILITAVFFIISCFVSFRAETIETLIASRFAMGLAAAGPRAVSLAIVRDQYSGRKMARIMSLAMMVFSLVPAVGPLVGSFIIDIWGWREIFMGFILFMMVTASWLGIRQPETLAVGARRPFRLSRIRAGVVDVMTTPIVVISILGLALSYGMLFATIVTIQPTFDQTFDRGAEFPWWFALTALLAMSSSFINARLVERLGMRPLIAHAKLGQAVFSTLVALTFWIDLWPTGLDFAIYFVWATSIFWMLGFTIGNLNALAMEPMGHIAGLASSIVASVGTVLGIGIAVPIGLAFNGSPAPVMAGIALTALVSVVVMSFARKMDRETPVSE